MRVDSPQRSFSDPAASAPPASEHLRQRASLSLPGSVVMSRDTFEPVPLTHQGSAQPLNTLPPSAFEMEAPNVPRPPRRSAWASLCPWCTPATAERVQTANQRGWLGHFIRWMPLLGVVVGTVSLYFAVRNFRLIYAQRTYSLLEQTRPILAQGINEILAQIARIQAAMGLNDTAQPLPPLPPEKNIHSG